MAIEELDAVALSFGLFACLYGLFSYQIKERLYLSEAPLAFLVGILIGPYGLGQLTKWDGEGEDAAYADQISLGLSRIVIGIQVALVGVQLPKYYLIHELRSLSIMLIPVMACMWLITAVLITWVIPDVPLIVALVIAASATPTDPVLSNALVKGSFADQYVPARLRNVISAESGCNDGLAYPFLFLAIRLLKAPTTSQALGNWLLTDIVYTVVAGAAMGVAIGLAANRALRFSCRHDFIDKESFLLFGPMLGLASIGLAGAMGLDDVLVSFVAGNAFTYDDWYRVETEEDEVQNVLDFLLNSIFFAFAGAAVPFATFNLPDLGITPWRLIVLAVLVLLLRRLPPMLLFYKAIPALRDVSEAAFVGYFGPIGAGAILYASIILHEFPLVSDGLDPMGQRVRELIRPITFVLVLASLLGHTLLVPAVKFFLDARGARDERHEAASADEGEDDDEAAEEHYESGMSPPPEDSQGQRRRGPGSVRGRSSMVGTPDVEMAQPASSVHHATLRARSSSTTADVNAAYCRRRSTADGSLERGNGGVEGASAPHVDESSWRHSSGHKLGPHRAVEAHERDRSRRG
ncbi:hypothetical protein BDZ90DRAFT_264309 [Jaminaea rosea]|uniref:Cation/H+ exchanger transmembrane domain-containing protein n=1 Tax=Jaminaea rosea TaxID=1569628 RepID=A0A316USY7_9BASI|nr:hypothetical protein BDZ90DRAFT_264309 [Jaminaea rosea]PWN28390.1 hypothetical protein BDZ90DRAFT_264309 [Jaminaea rosea]